MYGVLAAAGPSFVLHLLVAAGAALIVGALGSNAESVKITDFKQIYRGYANIIEDLQKLGVKIVQN